MMAQGDFPFLDRRVNGLPIIYLDNAATTQKPRVVIDQIATLYRDGLTNVHRAANFLGDETTQAFEDARDTVARFLQADASEIVFFANATQAINVLCVALATAGQLRVITSTLEHHSNLLPWARNGTLAFVPWAEDGTLDLDALGPMLAAGADLVALSASSNFLGAVQPIRDIVETCHRYGVPVLIDASQSVAHQRLDVRSLDCDFLVFSGHKVYGPSGVGVLYSRGDRLQALTPVFVGGGMVKEVHADRWVPNDLPHRFEPGTPHIEGVIGLAAALDYVDTLSWPAIEAHEQSLVLHAKNALSALRGVRVLGPAPGRPCVPLVSFQLQGLEPAAVARALSRRRNIVLRSGFHCAQPAHDRLGAGPTLRASFAVYNTHDEIDVMVDLLQSLEKLV